MTTIALFIHFFTLPAFSFFNSAGDEESILLRAKEYGISQNLDDHNAYSVVQYQVLYSRGHDCNFTMRLLKKDESSGEHYLCDTCFQRRRMSDVIPIYSSCKKSDRRLAKR